MLLLYHTKSLGGNGDLHGYYGVEFQRLGCVRGVSPCKERLRAIILCYFEQKKSRKFGKLTLLECQRHPSYKRNLQNRGSWTDDRLEYHG
jgi:hypothetical protein